MAKQPAQPEVPVYLFTGFLEAGKTDYIQETLEDKEFNEGERTRLLICEEGENEYDPLKFAQPDTTFAHIVENESDLTPQLLDELQAKYDIQRVLVEYNGMWMLDSLFNSMPESWVIYQEFMFADAGTFLSYNANMRQLTYDKMTTAELVVFNRWKAEYSKEEFHKLVRVASRNADIVFEYDDEEHTLERDEIVDPLPFDINADIIEIKDEDYALWYRDINEEMKKYDGKTVRFKAQVAGIGKLPAGYFLPGRFVMTCCVEDIRFGGLLCRYKDAARFRNRDWVNVTAKIRIAYHQAYKGEGPILTAVSVVPANPAEPDVATFY